MLKIDYHIDYKKYPEELHYFLKSLPTITKNLATTYSTVDIETLMYDKRNNDIFREKLSEILPEKFKYLTSSEKPIQEVIYAAYKEGKVYQCSTQEEALAISKNTEKVLMNENEIKLYKNINKYIDEILITAHEVRLSEDAFDINLHKTMYRVAWDDEHSSGLNSVASYYGDLNTELSIAWGLMGDTNTKSVFDSEIEKLNERFIFVANVNDKYALNIEELKYVLGNSKSLDLESMVKDLTNNIDYQNDYADVKQEAKEILEQYFPNFKFDTIKEEYKYAAYKGLEAKIFNTLEEAKQFSNKTEKIIENKDELQINKKMDYLLNNVTESAFSIYLAERSQLPPKVHNFVFENQVDRGNDYYNRYMIYNEYIENLQIDKIPEYIKLLQNVKQTVDNLNKTIQFTYSPQPQNILFKSLTEDALTKEQIRHSYMETFLDKLKHKTLVDNLGYYFIHYLNKNKDNGKQIVGDDFYKLISTQKTNRNQELLLEELEKILVENITHSIDFKLQLSNFIGKNINIKEEQDGKYHVYLNKKEISTSKEVINVIIENKPDLLSPMLNKAIYEYCELNGIKLDNPNQRKSNNLKNN